MPPLTLITAALPYANGSLHLGHLVEYCMVDMLVRARRSQGENIAYLCANDAHGTPIEINAKKQGLTPEALVDQVHAEHKRDFARFGVDFDHFTTTHSQTNAEIVYSMYAALSAGGDLDERAVDQHFCTTCQRFLPDRFIKGQCPTCRAPDQYGDVCEKCSATYSPNELTQPYCVICHNTPEIRRSTHLFFRLTKPVHTAFLKQFIDSGALQEDVANYVRHWIDAGLKDWCISRDGPYFGFAIPDRPGKYFYVWLDAPIGYIAAATEWGRSRGLTTADLWQNPNTRIEHVIGKDILYFHTLFWPAVLHATGYTLPAKVFVHGMLTVNGEKMSKSRGTFITAKTFADAVSPEALRYYYATKYSAQNQDMDLSFSDFLGRVNGELVNKHANLFSRVSQFLWQKFDGALCGLPFAAAEAQQDHDQAEDGSMLALARQVVGIGRRVQALYQSRDIGQLVRELALMADIGNEFMQGQKPWAQMQAAPQDAQRTCTFVANVCYALAMYLAPIVPNFASAGMALLGAGQSRGQISMDAGLLFAERNRKIGAPRRLFERIEAKTLQAMMASSMPTTATAGAAAEQLAGIAAQTPRAGSGFKPAQAATANSGPGAGQTASKDAEISTSAAAEILMADFAAVDLRAGRIVQAEAVPKSKKLLRLMVDLGEMQPRQIISGLAEAYTPAELLNKQVVVVANLKPAKIMGHTSNGMVLAAGTSPKLSLCTLASELPPGSSVR